MEALASTDSLASLMTATFYCAREGVKAMQSKEHFYRLSRIINDLGLHIETRHRPYTLVGDLLIRNVPLKDEASPDIALLPDDLDSVADFLRSLDLSADLRPVQIQEAALENT